MTQKKLRLALSTAGRNTDELASIARCDDVVLSLRLVRAPWLCRAYRRNEPVRRWSADRQCWRKPWHAQIPVKIVSHYFSTIYGLKWQQQGPMIYWEYTSWVSVYYICQIYNLNDSVWKASLHDFEYIFRELFWFSLFFFYRCKWGTEIL